MIALHLGAATATAHPQSCRAGGGRPWGLWLPGCSSSCAPPTRAGTWRAAWMLPAAASAARHLSFGSFSHCCYFLPLEPLEQRIAARPGVGPGKAPLPSDGRGLFASPGGSWAGGAAIGWRPLSSTATMAARSQGPPQGGQGQTLDGGAASWPGCAAATGPGAGRCTAAAQVAAATRPAVPTGERKSGQRPRIRWSEQARRPASRRGSSCPGGGPVRGQQRARARPAARCGGHMRGRAAREGGEHHLAPGGY